MKYLAKYENIKEYKVGDYFLIQFNFKNIKITKGKILKITPDEYYPYRVRFDNNTVDTIRKNEIIRHLNPDEIEEYETKIQAIKYNL